MSIREEWQLVAHAPTDLTPAEGSVAQAIARRIKPGQPSERIPQRTLYAESVGVKSKDTIKRALAKLEALGVIEVRTPPKGSRLPSVITWALECPGDCRQDHSNGNKKTARTVLERQLEELEKSESQNTTRPTPQDTTRPTPQGALRSIKKERDRSLLDCIEEALKKVHSKTEGQEALEAALADSSLRAGVRTAAELLAVKAEQNPENYLAQIAISSPHKLLPRAPRTAKALTPPDLSHLPREVAAERLAAWEQIHKVKAVS
jgi:DNA-binding transcriptional MocR family regulator